mmetsp:Transcript_9423/g.22673  ORF Transcript_9423/g.22673 Transcript_9423/m.22673 type:complete len:589 (-) Transcript_9423:152-1918(-)
MRGDLKLQWSEEPVMPGVGCADGLDDAMNVLTHLLMDLESELRDIATTNGVPQPPAFPQPKGDLHLSDKTGKVDNALNVLNAQLLELEKELKEGVVPPSNGTCHAEELKARQGEAGMATTASEVMAKPLATAPMADRRSQPPAVLHSSLKMTMPASLPAGQLTWGWRLPPAPAQQFQPIMSPRPSRISQEPAPKVPLGTSAAAMACAAMSATANLTPATAPVLTSHCRSVSPAPVGTGKMQPMTPPPLVPKIGSAWRSPSEGRFFRADVAQSPMHRQHPDGWRSPAALPTAPGSLPMCRSTPSPRQSTPAGLGSGAHLASSQHPRASWRSPSEGRVVHQVFTAPDGQKMRTPRFEMGTSPMQRQDGFQSPTALVGPHSFTICRSSGSLSSSNPSFYKPPGAVGPGFSQVPVVAAAYIVDLADPIDQLLGTALRTLDAAASKLTLRRLASGRYEIDGRRVTLRWEQGGSGLVVTEDEVRDARGSAMPLQAYLKSAGNVAASLSGQRADMPKIARVPKSQRLTFDDAAPAEQNLASQIEKLGSERCESMRLAVEQARLREQAAEAYEKLNLGRVLPPPPPQITAMQFPTS